MLSEWGQFGPISIHVGSKFYAAPNSLRLGQGRLAYRDVTTIYSGPYADDSGYELRRMGDSGSSLDKFQVRLRAQIDRSSKRAIVMKGYSSAHSTIRTLTILALTTLRFSVMC